MALEHTNLWNHLSRKLEADKKELVDQLIQPQSEISTAHLRGKIAMIDEIIERYPGEMKLNDEDKFIDE